MIVFFDTRVFTGSESSGNIIVSLELIRNSSFMNGEISVLVIPSNQLPLSAKGKRTHVLQKLVNVDYYQVMEWITTLILSLLPFLLELIVL